MPARLNLDCGRIVSLYQSGKTGAEIAHLMGCTTPPIYVRLEEQGIHRRPSGRSRPDIDTATVVSMYQVGLSSEVIARHFKADGTTIVKRLKDAGVKLHTISEWRSKPVNGQVFDNIDTEEKAYWLGFILADGCVHIPKIGKTPRFCLGLSKKDRSHLVKLRSFLGAEHSLVAYRTVISLSINSRPLCDGLMKWGVVPRKSYNFQGLPKIVSGLKHHMVRGLFDGDGHIGIHKDRHEKKPVVHLVGHRQCLEEIRETFKPLCKHYPKITKPTAAKSECVGEMKWSARADTIAILHYLYKDATVYLERKKEKADEIISRWGQK